MQAAWTPQFIQILFELKNIDIKTMLSSMILESY